MSAAVSPFMIASAELCPGWASSWPTVLAPDTGIVPVAALAAGATMDPAVGWALVALGGAIVGGVMAGVLVAASARARRAADCSQLEVRVAEAEAAAAAASDRLARAESTSADAIAAYRSQTTDLERALSERRQEAESATRDLVRAEEELTHRREREAELLADRAREHELRESVVRQAEERLAATFGATGRAALEANNRQFLELARSAFEQLAGEARGDVARRAQAVDEMIRPVRELLEQQRTAVAELEQKREAAYASMTTQMRQIADAHTRLGAETGRLVTALRRPEQRGRWGEMQLRNAVELAGMVEHCDFSEQPATDDQDTRERPDMIVRLPGDGVIVVDAKVALDAYLDAIEPDADRAACLERHAQQVEAHWRRLASKAYWKQFERTPQMVVMFMPLESALVAALERRPDLHADAMNAHVLIATPTLLIALLRAAGHGWQHEALAHNTREVAATGRKLYERLGTFAGHLGRVGERLRTATEAYNRSVGSLERSIVPAARQLKDLSVVGPQEADLPGPPLVDVEPRRIVAAELTTDLAADLAADLTADLTAELTAEPATDLAVDAGVDAAVDAVGDVALADDDAAERSPAPE